MIGVRNTTKIASISLDIRKNNAVNNDPIVLRQGDNDVIIEASISNDGYPDLGISFATFVAKKPDGTIISNDPANVSGNTISYPISKHLTESVGKIQDAYFMINNEVTTNGFDISIIPSTQFDDTSVDYIPGIENINKFLESAEADWLGRIQQMKTQIAGLDIPDEFKLLMDKALSDAKAQYQPTIDAAEENVESIVADLAAKKLDLTNNSDELNQTITTIKAQVASINSFLDSIQKQIIDANSSFTTDQQNKVSQSIASMQNNLSTAMAKAIADTNASIQQIQQRANDINNSIHNLQIGGRNLLLGTSDYSYNWTWNVTPSIDTSQMPAILHYPSTTLTGGGSIIAEQDIGTILQPSTTYTVSFYAKGSGNFKFFCYPAVVAIASSVNGIVASATSDDCNTSIPLTSSYKLYTITFTTLSSISGDKFFCLRQDYDSNSPTVEAYVYGIKLEKGNVATDWTPAPEDKADESKVVELQKQVDNSAVGTNLFSQATATAGYVDGITGGIDAASSSNEIVSDYIPVSANFNYTFQMWGTTPSNHTYWYGIGLYDSDKKFISRQGETGGMQTSDTAEHVSKNLTTTSTTAYVRVSFSKYNDYKAKLEKGSVATDWSVNPTEILTQADYAKIKAAIVALKGSLS